MTASSPHVIEIGVEAAHIDFMGHVNNATYLTWVQDAVLSHWRRRASPEAIAAYVWVALKHEITYRRPAFLRDRLVAVVVLEQVRRESAFYDTIIRRGDEVIAEVKSRWCCLDARTRLPTRLAQDVVDRFAATIG